MADGSLKAIAEVKEGDYVFTGFAGDTGLVTEVLTHKVRREVPVAVVQTVFGDLVGTPDHPIYFKNQWVELSDALELSFDKTNEEDGDRSSVPVIDGRIESQHIDLFYNLEIDGNAPGMSSHSYVVNGIIASGLGDNVLLNSLFARQEAWKVA